MKKILVIALVAVGVCCASLAHAAPKRKAGQNRVGPYATGAVGMTVYGGDHADEEQILRDILSANEIPQQNLVSSTDDSDVGFQVSVGYRFNRYFAAEISFAQFGELSTTASADLDFPDDNVGFQPADLELTFKTAGPIFSALGILPINEHFELFARAGLFFSSFTRGFTSRINGQTLSGSARSDDQRPVYGAGAAWNISKVYSLRAEYQVINGIGDANVSRQDV